MSVDPVFAPPLVPFPGSRAGTLADAADAVLFDAPHGTPYDRLNASLAAGAGQAFRRALADDARWVDHWDFDLGGPLLGQGRFRLIDAGTLGTTAGDGAGNRALIAEATRRIVSAGAIPLMIGGDDSVPIPFFEALGRLGPLTVVQIDAHIDWRDQRRGERFGFSSTMRRASEMAHVEHIVQVGIRGLGSARAEEVEIARDWGAQIITAHDVRRGGVESVLSEIPEGSPCAVTLDCDALDIGIMSAVAAPTPGGLGYHDVIELIALLGARRRIVAFDIIEFVPDRDPDGAAAYTAARIVANLVGALARQHDAGRARPEATEQAS